MPDITPTSKHITDAREDGDALILTLSGEIDLHSSPGLRSDILQYLQKNTVKRLVLNLGGVPYVDSSAIAVMVEALQKLRKADGKVYLTDLTPRVKGLLQIARLDSIFVVCADEADALKK